MKLKLIKNLTISFLAAILAIFNVVVTAFATVPKVLSMSESGRIILHIVTRTADCFGLKEITHAMSSFVPFSMFIALLTIVMVVSFYKKPSLTRTCALFSIWGVVINLVFWSTPWQQGDGTDLKRLLDVATPTESASEFVDRIPSFMNIGDGRLRRLPATDINPSGALDSRNVFVSEMKQPEWFLDISCETNTCNRIFGKLFGDSITWQVTVFFTHEKNFCGFSAKTGFSAPWRFQDQSNFDSWTPDWAATPN